MTFVNVCQNVQHEDGRAQPSSLHPGQPAGVAAVPQVAAGPRQVWRAELAGGGSAAEEGEHHLHQPGELAGRDLAQPVRQREVQPQPQTPAGRRRE